MAHWNSYTALTNISYDGDDFLAFDDATMQWVAPVDQALPTKRKWDGVQILNQYTKGYLEKECVDWVSKFMAYGGKVFSRADCEYLWKRLIRTEYLNKQANNWMVIWTSNSVNVDKRKGIFVHVKS